MPDAIPHEALARAVRAAFGAGARIAAEERLFGDASSRRYVRLGLAGGDAPSTAVAMLLGADRFPLGSDEISEGAASRELPFVDVGRYLAARGFAVPAVLLDASASDALVLLEDIGDTTLWAAASARPADAPALFSAARASAALPLAGDLAARYRLCALQRALKVIGRFHYLERVLGKPGYLAYLPGVYAVARRMLDALPALAAVRPLLARHVPELA